MPNFSLPFVHTSTWNSGLGAVLTQQISWASGPVVPEKERVSRDTAGDPLPSLSPSVQIMPRCSGSIA